MDDKQLPEDSVLGRLLNNSKGGYWQYLEKLIGADASLEGPDHAFASHSSLWPTGLSRRKFLQMMGASIALAGLSSCMKQPDEKIVPYVKSPELIVPGEPLYFATAVVMGGYARGVLATSHMGRPTKLEGNPSHAASLGATDVFTQASILTLYDPDRSQAVTHRGTISAWTDFTDAFERAGKRIRILTGTVTSPTLGAQLRDFLRQFPDARWHQYEPVNDDSVRLGALLSFGENVSTQYRFDKADVILSLDSDFLFSGPASVRYAHDFAERRRLYEAKKGMNRLYVVESSPTVTGAMADHCLRMRSGEIEQVVHTLARKLNVTEDSQPSSDDPPGSAAWADAVADDLRKTRGRSLVIPGMHQPPRVHAMAHALNHALGNIDSTVLYADPIEAHPVDQLESLQQLVNDMIAGNVDVLAIIGGNPAYNSPADIDFAGALSKVRMSVHLGLYEDETSSFCDWHIPESHSLEAWGDARSYDGTATIIQPLIAPLYDSKSAYEFLDELMGHAGSKGYDIVRKYWMGQRPGIDFDVFWQKSLNDGVVADTAAPVKNVTLRINENIWAPAGEHRRVGVSDADDLEINFRPDPTIWDGQFANNAWLQELPKPLTKLTWDNAALLGPSTAGRLGLVNEDVAEIRCRGRTVRAPVYLLPGQPDNVVTLHLGYGRSRAGKVGTGTGFSAYALRASAAPWFDQGVQIRKTGAHYPLAVTQQHHAMEGRHEVRSATLVEFLKDPSFAKEMDPAPSPDQTLYPPHEYTGYAWGMSIDLNSCIGCNACVVACQAENNIPVVGKEQVADSREMHWIRIDTYYEGEPSHPETYVQPVPCMHCENAPCELVCPVGATVHDSEGLNVMVYNRCIGTRYCSNNCPYKVRRFNFLQYVDNDSLTLKMQRNPDVTVRSRGVMEKCTYCVQRINAARIRAEKEDRPIRDGDVVTACQSACPTRAIHFGDINDPKSKVARLKADPRDYGLLAELNTKPRTTYLAKVKNPHPEFKG